MYEAPSAPQSIGGVLDSGFRLFRRSLGGAFALAFASQLVLAPVSSVSRTAALAGAGTASAGATLLLLAMLVVLVPAGLVLSVAVIARIHAVSQQRAESLRESIRVGLRRAIPVFVAAVLWAIGVTVGLILLIVPGLYLMIAMAFGPYAAVTERRGPIDAIGYSFAIMRGNWWRTAAVLTIVGILMFVLYLLIVLVIAAVFALGGAVDVVAGTVTSPWYVDYVIGPLVGGVLTVLTNSMALAVLADLKLRYEGADLAERIAAAGT